ncbi:O-antigen ligase domain-containing protein, partial [Acinetobacter baumannii]
MLVKNITSFGVVIYLITALLGYRIGWSVFQYDELRLLQFPLALCALLILLLTKEIKFSIFTQITFFIIGVFILIQHINWGIF